MGSPIRSFIVVWAEMWVAENIIAKMMAILSLILSMSLFLYNFPTGNFIFKFDLHNINTIGLVTKVKSLIATG